MNQPIEHFLPKMDQQIKYPMTEEDRECLVDIADKATSGISPMFPWDNIVPKFPWLLNLYHEMGLHRAKWAELLIETASHVTEESYEALVRHGSFGFIIRRHYENLLQKDTESEKKAYEDMVKNVLIKVFRQGRIIPLLLAVGPAWQSWHRFANTPMALNEANRCSIISSISFSVFQYPLEVQERIESRLELIVNIVSEFAHAKIEWNELVVQAATQIPQPHYDDLLLMGQAIGRMMNACRDVVDELEPELVKPFEEGLLARLFVVFQFKETVPLMDLIEPMNRMFYPVEFPSAAEVERRRQEYATKIFNGHEYLEKIWSYCRQGLQERWTEKGKSARETILADAFPNLHDKFREAFQGFTAPTLDVPKQTEHWKFAQMNKEELGNGTNLMSLIQIRATNPPDLFAFLDSEAAVLGHSFAEFRVQGLAQHTMLFRAQREATTYGKAILYKEKIPGRDWWQQRTPTLWEDGRGTRAAVAEINGETLKPSYGLLVLEFQARLYEGLAKCCESLASDTEQAMLAEKPRPTKREIKAGDVPLNLPWPTAVSEALFYQPTHPLRFQDLINQTESRRLQAEEHLWALRENPEIFTATIKRVHGHLPEFIKVKKSRKTTQADMTAAPYIETAIKHAVIEAIADLFIWNAIESRLIALQETLNSEEIRNVNYDQRLPQHVQDECVDLLQILTLVQAGAGAFLKQCVDASPRFRLNYERDPNTESPLFDETITAVSNSTRVIELNTHIKRTDNYLEAYQNARTRWRKGETDERPVDLRDETCHKPGSKLPYEKKDRTKFWGFWKLFNVNLMHAGESFDTNSKPLYYDEARRQIDNDPEIKEVATEYVQHQLLDLAFIADCYTRLYCYVPWAQSWSSSRCKRKRETEALFGTIIEPVDAIKNALVNTPNWIKNLRPLFRGLKYPIFEKRTRDNVQKLQFAENALAEFWAGFDAVLDSIDPRWPTLLTDLFRGNRVATRTPDWVEPVELGKRAADDPPEEDPVAKRPRIQVAPAPVPIPAPAPAPVPAPVPAPAPAPAPAPIPARPRAQPKQPKQPKQPARQPTFRVNKADLDVFHTIFHVPGTPTAGGNINWRDFRSAMTHIGFGVTPAGGGGSAFSFVPPATLTGRAIVLHAPHHPSPTLYPHNYRAIGRRLRDNYGLEWNDFGPS